MGVEDSIRKAAENAMEDLAGTSDPVDDQHVPEPGAKDDNVQAPSGDVPGPAGLPDGTPDELRADPSEGDQDPSTSMGRG